MSEKKMTATTPEMPRSRSVSRMLDWDIKAQPPVPPEMKDTILTVEDLKMHFPVTKGLLKRVVGHVKAVDGVSFRIARGKTLGIVGESGSGKSTVGNCVMRRLNITSGKIIFNGQDISRAGSAELRRLHKQLQMITQDPFSALDPRMSVRSIILEGHHIQGMDQGDEPGGAG